MSFKDLVEPECGGANPLMNLGRQVTRDVAFQDEGFVGGRSAFIGSDNDLVKEFMGQIAPAPQSFRMDVLLKEMRDIDAQNFHQPLSLSRTINIFFLLLKVWSNSQLAPIEESFGAGPSNILYAKDFFDLNEPKSEEEQKTIRQAAGELAEVAYGHDSEKLNYSEVSHVGFAILDDWSLNHGHDDWAKAFEDSKKGNQEATENYNKQFWERLQDEWRSISENESQHPWLSEFSEFYDPYKEYKFDEENPMSNVENAFEKGKAFLAQGDIPSAVLCFEAAVKQDPENPEIWELLGFSQAENEKDPNAIAALNKALSFNPNNMPVLMALAVSYTNESMQNQALKMLVKWMKCNPKYEALVPPQMLQAQESPLASSLMGGPSLQDVQDLYIKAVQTSPSEIDADIQEALGVLFNLSSEYDKAVDCFRAAVQVRPNSSKIWNRLGASLANGNRSVEAVEAYQRALDIQPGFIRARYNVGIICINLKAYKEAAEHLLTALNHQASSIARSGINVSSPANQMSSTIWITLRMVMSLMGRQDLQQAIDNRDLDILNREFLMSND
ncbi:peroxisomal targeting signal 1 receptor [Culex quinquefasciatus]|uniref:Peroxisomal targeting signal 1 receptor n=1 Tax=Culex quinquefasciatus TaxID=7176 RepID=B0W5M6_CULQU|nr:peroxisomal targeting signal 1 receptor [Culex quinquefasciatus]|eukprot:XP_001844010.1 peroxisomal targeting signal 1 receptor [Culex quinquefasciatus]